MLAEPNAKDSWALVREAFTRQAEEYDAYEERNLILHWMRDRVHRHVSRFMKSSDYVLELNAGTGTDAVHFARKGNRVMATDISEGMLKKLSEKVKRNGLDDLVAVRACSYTELDRLGEKSFDYVFSNFGGLNCLSDLTQVTDHLPKIMKAGGVLTLVIMPPVCPWEIIELFRGSWKRAVRRFARGGATAHILGVRFRAFYFSPSRIERTMGPAFHRVSLEGLATFSPPPHKIEWALRHPRVYRFLTWLDERTALWPPFRSWADHFILTMQYNPGSV